MKVSKVTKFVAVQEKTAEAFQSRMNEVLTNAKNPQITFPDALFTAYIQYEEDVKEKESAEDDYVSANGEPAHCGDCPYLERSKDKRVKYHTCRYSENARKVTANACELYYQRYFNGNL